jgi:hypothetical protein
MARGKPVMSALEEQHRGFNDGYRMTCECGGNSYISGADYHVRSTIDARMPCEHCDRTIHFGPAVAALRNRDDQMLDNDRINRLAWYHSSTQSDWPSPSYAAEREAAIRAIGRDLLGDRVDAFIERQLNQTLHVGTYEAAIENMLRRMVDQDDATSQFYLHRIALVVDPSRVNHGYRDENHESAAQLTTTELRQGNLDAVRYLNVRESVGSISLAVLPETIAYVQTLALPISALSPAGSESLLRLVEQAQESLDRGHANAPDTSTSTLEQLRLAQLLRRGDDSRGTGATRTREHYESWGSLDAALNEQLLGNVSPVIQEQFVDAMTAWRHEQEAPTLSQYADFYASSAVALTRPDEVKALLATYEPRSLANTMPPLDRS